MLAAFNQLAVTAQTFEHAMKGDVSEIGGEVLTVFKQALLLLRNTIQTTVVIDDDDDWCLLLEGSLDAKTTRQERAIPANQDNA